MSGGVDLKKLFLHISLSWLRNRVLTSIRSPQVVTRSKSDDTSAGLPFGFNAQRLILQQQQKVQPPHHDRLTSSVCQPTTWITLQIIGGLPILEHLFAQRQWRLTDRQTYKRTDVIVSRCVIFVWRSSSTEYLDAVSLCKTAAREEWLMELNSILWPCGLPVVVVHRAR